jgi:hypothetical protein
MSRLCRAPPATLLIPWITSAVCYAALPCAGIEQDLPIAMGGEERVEYLIFYIYSPQDHQAASQYYIKYNLNYIEGRYWEVHNIQWNRRKRNSGMSLLPRNLRGGHMNESIRWSI